MSPKDMKTESLNLLSLSEKVGASPDSLKM